MSVYHLKYTLNMDDMIKELYTEHLHLRKAKDSDLESVLKNVWSDESLSSMMLWKNTFTVEDAKERLERTIKYQAVNNAFFVCLKDSDEVIGFGGIHEEKDGIFEDSGICIAPRYQRLGYGRELLKALLRLAFEECAARRFIYSSFSDNEPSIRLCLSCGFSYLGCSMKIREKDGMEYQCNEYYLDRDDYFSNKDQ